MLTPAGLRAQGTPERHAVGVATYVPVDTLLAQDLLPAAEPAEALPARGVGLARVSAYDAERDRVVDVTAAARAGRLTYPRHWTYIQVELTLPGQADHATQASAGAIEYAIVAARTGAVPAQEWIPFTGESLRISSLQSGERQLRIRSHPPGEPARVDVPLALSVARPWYRHPIAFAALAAVLIGLFLAYRQSWKRDVRRTRRRQRPPEGTGGPPRSSTVRGEVTPDEVGEVELAPTLEADLGDLGPAVVDPPAAPPPEPEPEPAALAELHAAIEAHYGDPEFSTERLAELLAVSRRTLSRMSVPLTGQTPGKLIANRRLERARELLEAEGGVQVKAVAAAVGYKSADGFARAFRDRYGVSPSGYVRRGRASA